jgi:hypothetical protein
VNVVLVMVDAFIVSLKTAVTALLLQTPVEPFGGVTDTTVGGGLHPFAAVVNVQE